MRVPNVKFWSARQRGGGEAGRAHHCKAVDGKFVFGLAVSPSGIISSLSNPSLLTFLFELTPSN